MPELDSRGAEAPVTAIFRVGFLEFVIGAAGLIDLEQVAEIVEMRLRRRVLAACVAAPPVDELFRVMDA